MFPSRGTRRVGPGGGSWGRTASVFLALLLLGPACGGKPKPPNVIVVTLDTTRADHIGCYGADFAHTPNLDALAREGVRFDRAVTPVPMTLPSHTTMMTGSLPPRHGVRNNGAYQLGTGAETLAERFAAAGYETGAFVSAFVLDRQFGLAQGFAAYDDSLFNERPSSMTLARAKRWLERRSKERPVFVWMHLFDAHTPWTPAAPFSKLNLPSAYDQEIAADDAAVGGLIEELKRLGRWENTVIAVLADHGEGLGDHGEAEHGIFLYQETTRIPWVIRAPKLGARGLVVETVVSTTDLMPTLLELAGLPPVTNIDGKSLVALIDPKQKGAASTASGGEEGAGALGRPGVYLETLYPKENFGWAPLYAFETEEWKWIRAPESELYRLRDDPKEATNLVGSEAEQGATLDRRLSRLLQNLPAAPSQNQTAVSPEVEERLRSLGYLSGGSLTQGAETDLPDPKRMIAAHGDFEEAKRAMDDQRYADAIAPFQRVIAREAKNKVALLGLGIALVKTARFGEAEAILRRAIEISPGNATAQSGLADAFFGQEKWNDAADLYRLAAADRTNARHVNTRLALCLLQQGKDAELTTFLANAQTADRGYYGDIARRIEAWKQVAKSSGPDSLALVRARAAAGAGLQPVAERILSTRLRDPRAERQRLALLSTFFAETGRPERALEAIDQVRAGGPLSTEQSLSRAALLLRAGRPEEALAEYEALPASLPKTVRAVIDYNRGCALARLGRLEEAISGLESAVANGYDRAGQLLNDVDLRPIRSEERFQTLIERLSAGR
ncbi:MAG: sulfatase-like hydrolase/transferase [Candidatus Eisenbacteria bacterium]|nr:sulfatase-like hydrolase/transferase [Candidatus Eisenbacteria bacterium]